VAVETRPTVRDRILDAGVRLFGERGYDQLSMRDLAGAAGCSPANLYHHFRSKYELFFTIIEEAMLLHLAGLEEALRTREDPVDQLRHVVETHLRLHLERPEVRLLTRDFHPLRGEERARFAAQRDRYEHGVRAIVSRAVADGRLRVEDPKLAVMVALAGATEVERWYRPEGELPRDEVVRRIADFLMDGFRGCPR
jgi:TetR/AcrR family transcriptional regulator, cholesterol catabolism regulator